MAVDLSATAIFVLVTLITPGPNNILCGSMGVMYGYRRTLPFILGIGTGVALVMLACAALATALTSMLPSMDLPLRIAGTLYILWLAVGVYRSGDQLLAATEEAKPFGYSKGLFLQFVNLKCILFGLTVFSAFLGSIVNRPSTWMWAPLALGCVALAVTSVWAIGGHSIRRWINTRWKAKVLTVVLALALCYTALDLSGVLDLLGS